MGRRFLIAEPPVIAVSMALGEFYDGQSILYANDVTQSPHGKRAVIEISELSLTFQRSRVPDNVVVNVFSINVSCHNKGMISLEKAHSKFIADAVGLLRRDLTGLERLPHLISDHVAPLFPPGGSMVLSLGEKKL